MFKDTTKEKVFLKEEFEKVLDKYKSNQSQENTDEPDWLNKNLPLTTRIRSRRILIVRHFKSKQCEKCPKLLGHEDYESINKQFNSCEECRKNVKMSDHKELEELEELDDIQKSIIEPGNDTPCKSPDSNSVDSSESMTQQNLFSQSVNSSYTNLVAQHEQIRTSNLSIRQVEFTDLPDLEESFQIGDELENALNNTASIDEINSESTIDDETLVSNQGSEEASADLHGEETENGSASGTEEEGSADGTEEEGSADGTEEEGSADGTEEEGNTGGTEAIEEGQLSEEYSAKQIPYCLETNSISKNYVFLRLLNILSLYIDKEFIEKVLSGDNSKEFESNNPENQQLGFELENNQLIECYPNTKIFKVPFRTKDKLYITLSKGNILFANSEGRILFSEEETTVLHLADTILLANSSGKIWISKSTKSFWLFKNRTKKKVEYEESGA